MAGLQSKRPEGYEDLLRDLKDRVRAARVQAALAVNRELVLLYWSIGRDILERQDRLGWGAKVIDQLATDLGKEFTYETGATIEVLRPSRGESGLEGQIVTISGQHFQASGQPRCRFGQDQTVQGRVLSSTLIACKVPVHGAGTVTVGLSDGGLAASGSL